MVGRLEQFVRGFTLVEMISVLVILGAVSALVMSRLSDTGAFDERLARDQLLLIARTAHQLGFSRSSVDLYFQDTGSEIRIAARVGGVEQASRTFPKSEVTVTVDGTSTGGSPGVCSSLTSPITLQFDSNAEVSGAYPSGNYNQGFPICLNGNTPNICVSPAGFAHLGSCV
jgi:prepilin-type N-terminal cleavage/methylation domain-containing protein